MISSVDDALRPVIESLLGRVLIYETLDDAVYAAEKLAIVCASSRWRAIFTRQVMTGGYRKKIASGLLGRSRELKNLEAERIQLAARLQHVESDLAGSTDELIARAAIEKEHAEIDAETTALLNEKRQEHKQQTLDFERQTARKHRLETEIERLLVEETSKKRAHAERSDEQERVQCSFDQLAAQIQSALADEQPSEAERNALREQITDLRVSVGSVMNRFKVCSTSESTSRLKRREKRLAQINAATVSEQLIERYRDERMSIDESLHTLRQDIRQAELDVEALRLDRQAIEQEQRDFFGEIDVIGQRLAALHSEQSRLEAKLERLAGLDDQIKNRLWEEYQLTAVC